MINRYGMSKDFCSNGLRAGVIVSQANPQVLQLCSILGIFGWPSSLSDLAWCLILENDSYLRHYVATMQRTLGENYDRLVTFLEEHSIDYVKGSNAGFFIWANFQNY